MFTVRIRNGSGDNWSFKRSSEDYNEVKKLFEHFATHVCVAIYEDGEMIEFSDPYSNKVEELRPGYVDNNVWW